MIYVGAENIVAPLGLSASEAFSRILNQESSVQLHTGLTPEDKAVPASVFSDEQRGEIQKGEQRFISDLAVYAIQHALRQVDGDLLNDPKTLLILSTTKGDVDRVAEEPQHARLGDLAMDIAHQLGFQGTTEVISNACISGILSVITAADLLATGSFKHAIVCGVDLVTRFTVSGFDSFYAIASDSCRPYAADRKGIALGEGAGVVVLSVENIFRTSPFQYLGGACANDANHISGPSRTGEGLFRAVKRCLAYAGLLPTAIDQISAHGTATRYNDDMESIAFNRAELGSTPLHSLKGYTGHTLGAAGLIELAATMQSARNGVVPASWGSSPGGTTEPLAVNCENTALATRHFMKTASGFGGCNAAAIFRYDH